jgi:hypothetical protein
MVGKKTSGTVTTTELEQLRNELDAIASGADIHEVKTLAGSVFICMNYPDRVDLDGVAECVRVALRTKDFSSAIAGIDRLWKKGIGK